MASSTISVPGSQLATSGVFSLDITVPDIGLIFLTGTVYGPDLQIVASGAVVVNQYDASYNPPKFLYQSHTFTDENGVYGISMPYTLNSSYELKAYGP